MILAYSKIEENQTPQSTVEEARTAQELTRRETLVYEVLGSNSKELAEKSEIPSITSNSCWN